MYDLLRELAGAISKEINKLGYNCDHYHQLAVRKGHLTSVIVSRKIRYDISFVDDTFQIVSENDIVFWTTEFENPNFTPYRMARAILHDSVFRDENYSKE